MLFKNLRAEMLRAGLDVAGLAKKTGMKVSALYSRLNGTVTFSLDEAIAIKKVLGVEMPLEELFEVDK